MENAIRIASEINWKEGWEYSAMSAMGTRWEKGKSMLARIPIPGPEESMVSSSSDTLYFTADVLRADEMIWKDERNMRKALSSLHMYS